MNLAAPSRDRPCVRSSATTSDPERRRAGVRRFPYGIFFEIQEWSIGSWWWPASTAGASRGAGRCGDLCGLVVRANCRSLASLGMRRV